MDFVDEQDRAAPGAPQPLRIRHHRLDFLDPAQNRPERNKLTPSDARDELGERGFADAGRPPQDDGRQLVALDLAPQRLPGSKYVLLPDVVLEPLRPHAFRQRTPALRRPLIGHGVVEEAHSFAARCRRASYSRMPAATAALRDSTPTVGIEIPRERNSPLPPRASLPITSAQPPAKSTFAGAGPPDGTPAYVTIAFSSKAARAADASSACTYGTRKSDPADARSVFGLCGL